MKKYVLTFVLVGGLLVSLFFNSCSPEHEGQTEQFSVLKETVFVPCAFKDEMDLFSKTYFGFTTTNCSHCHVAGGIGKGSFASSGLLVAYNAFAVVGYDKISDYAINPSHQPPYTGTQHNATVSLLKDQWVKGLENIAACKNGGSAVDPSPVDETLRLDTKSKAISISTNNETKKLTWILPQEFVNKPESSSPLPQVGGVQLSIDVKKTILGGKSIYEISRPRVTTGTVDIKIQSLLIKLNGKLIPNQTTFRFIDESIRKLSSTEIVLAPGAMVVDGIISPTDVISVSIGQLSVINLPPPTPLPVVKFANSNIKVSETVNPAATSSAQNLLPVELMMNPAQTEQYVTVTVAIEGTDLPTAALNRRSQMVNFGTPLEIDRWNWDYQVDSLAVVFAPGETKKTLTFKISNDQRDEADETIHLRITSVTNAAIDTASGSHQAVITILDDDGPNVSGAPTFSSLMQPGGVLYEKCLRCHNSVDNRGGYNLSDYDLMIENGVLVPYDANSKMFVRMNAEIPGLRSMPLLDNGAGSLLDLSLRKQVENWITKNGAKND